MALTLRVDDEQDGTVTLTVAGVTGAGVVRAALFQGRTEAITWADVWAFTVDGTSPPQAVTPGHYFWTAFIGATISPAVYQPVTDPALALATRCRQAIISRIKLLDLAGIGDRVFERANFNETNISYPCVLVVPPAETETAGVDGGTNARSDVAHPVKVMIADRVNLDGAPEVMPPFEKWRQQVFRGFDREALPGVPIVMQTLVTPGAIFQPYITDNKYQITASELVIRAVARQPRGFGT